MKTELEVFAEHVHRICVRLAASTTVEKAYRSRDIVAELMLEANKIVEGKAMAREVEEQRYDLAGLSVSLENTEPE